MVKAIWNDTIVAESDDTIVVEGNHYFPVDAIKADLFKPSETTTVCGWKGTANYHSLIVDGKENRDAAWYYADPKSAAADIKGRIAFWKGVQIS